jgi:hypothetical protein
LLVQEFERTGTLLEKYDVYNCSADVSDEFISATVPMKLVLVGQMQFFWNY